MMTFLECLKKNDADHFPCRSASADYLKCRMDKDLMAKDDLNGNMPTENLLSYINSKKADTDTSPMSFESAYNEATKIFTAYH
jgi:hypothetical protein